MGTAGSERGFSSMEEQFKNHRDPDFWIAKIRRNVERDLEVTAALEAGGWTVVRVLESAVKRDTSKAADVVEAAVRGRPLEPNPELQGDP